MPRINLPPSCAGFADGDTKYMVPPGACNVVITATGGTAAVGPTPGSGQSMQLASAFQVVPGAAPTSFVTFPGSKGASLSVLSSTTAATVTVSYLISTDQ